jgi:hypothetical protein
MLDCNAVSAAARVVASASMLACSVSQRPAWLPPRRCCLQRGISRCAGGGFRIDIGLQRRVRIGPCGCFRVDVGLQRGISRCAGGGFRIDIGLQRRVGRLHLAEVHRIVRVGPIRDVNDAALDERRTHRHRAFLIGNRPES